MMRSSSESEDENLGTFHGKQIKDGAELRNINSFEYLKEIAKNITPDVLSLYPNLAELRAVFFDENSNEKDYDGKFDYGALYTSFLAELQQQITNISRDQEERFNHAQAVLHQSETTDKETLIQQIKQVDQFITVIYVNQNRALGRSAEFAKSSLGENESDISPKAKHKILDRSIGHSSEDTLTEKTKKGFNYAILSIFSQGTTPQTEEHPLVRFKATFIDSTYQPMLKTSIPSKRTYNHHQYKYHFPEEYRFGTQGEIIENVPRINPFFPAWLKAQERRRLLQDDLNDLTDNNALSEDELIISEQVPREKSRISHIYFNNLGLDRTDGEGKKERTLSLQLHQLENDHENLAVITLPADKGLMGHDMLGEERDHTYTLESVCNRIFDIATIGSNLQKATKDVYSDFYISNNVKVLLYGQPRTDEEKYDKAAEAEKMKVLLVESLHELGMDKKEVLSNAEIQALFFHFIKFKVTDFIIDKLNPDSINFTCKDAIDRGGVSSLYYNLIKSIELGVPMSESEFFEALHGAPTMVKGRGMNDHLDRIWNAISTYLDAQIKQGNPNIPDWLIMKKAEYDNNRIIDEVMALYKYKETSYSKTTSVTQDEYNAIVSNESHNKLGESKLGAVKRMISREFLDELDSLKKTSGTMSRDSVLQAIENLVRSALDKSKNARSDGKGNYHHTGTLESELDKVSRLISDFRQQKKMSFV